MWQYCPPRLPRKRLRQSSPTKSFHRLHTQPQFEYDERYQVSPRQNSTAQSPQIPRPPAWLISKEDPETATVIG